jgi:hypothetical protein
MFQEAAVENAGENLPDNLGLGASYGAATGGHLSILQWTLQRGLAVDYCGLVLEAAKGGHIAILRWALDVQGYPWQPQASLGAAAAGHLTVIRFAHERHLQLHKDTLLSAQSHSQQHICSFLNQRYP